MPTNSMTCSRETSRRAVVDKLRAIKSLRATGKIALGGGASSLDAEFADVVDQPDQMRGEITIQGLTQISASDGTDAWTVSPFQGRRDAERASVDDKRQIEQGAELDGPLVDWRTKGHRIEYLGIEE